VGIFGDFGVVLPKGEGRKGVFSIIQRDMLVNK
jgi:hypothetical protein